MYNYNAQLIACENKIVFISIYFYCELSGEEQIFAAQIAFHVIHVISTALFQEFVQY